MELVIDRHYRAAMYWDPDCEVKLVALGRPDAVHEVGMAIVATKLPGPDGRHLWQVRQSSLREVASAHVADSDSGTTGCADMRSPRERDE
jgi:hypothetical protein